MHSPPPVRFMRLNEVIALVGLARSTIYDRMAAGTFPRSRDLGGGTVRWRSDEIDAWFEACPETVKASD